MKNRTKLLAGLTAGTMALGAMCFGFAQWTTDITLSGSVSANGSWSVVVTDASMRTSANTHTYNSFDNDEYFTNSSKPKTTMNAKIAELEAEGYEIISSDATLKKYYAKVSYYPDANDTSTFINNEIVGYYDTADEAQAAAVAKKEEINANGGKVNSYGKSSVWGYEITYSLRTAATYDDTSVTYDPVEFTLAGDWAEYSVTITNKGTATANLSDYELGFSELDEIFTVDFPEFYEDEALAAGESCTLTFVIQVDENAEELSVESQPFTVTLKYAQDEVAEAPVSSHTHS